MNKLEKIVQELNSLDPKEVGSWPTYVYVAAVVIVVVVISVGSYFQLITPLLEDLAAAKAEETPLKEEFERKQRKVAALDALKEQLAEKAPAPDRKDQS